MCKQNRASTITRSKNEQLSPSYQTVIMTNANWNLGAANFEAELHSSVWNDAAGIKNSTVARISPMFSRFGAVCTARFIPYILHPTAASTFNDGTSIAFN